MNTTTSDSLVYIDRSDSNFNVTSRLKIHRLKPILSNENFVLLLQYCDQLSYCIHCCHGVCVVANKLARVTQKSFHMAYFERYSTILAYLQDRRHLSLRMRKLNSGNVQARAYTQASLPTDLEHSKQLRHYLILAVTYNNSIYRLLL